jgi:hypothetical protein
MIITCIEQYVNCYGSVFATASSRDMQTWRLLKPVIWKWKVNALQRTSRSFIDQCTCARCLILRQWTATTTTVNWDTCRNLAKITRDVSKSINFVQLSYPRREKLWDIFLWCGPSCACSMFLLWERVWHNSNDKWIKQRAQNSCLYLQFEA